MKKRPGKENPAGSGDHFLRKLFNGMGIILPENKKKTKSIDTFKSLRNLKAMLKNGQISKDEYEAIKLELLRH